MGLKHRTQGNPVDCCNGELLQAQGVCSHAQSPTSISLLWPQHTALCRCGHGTVSAGRLQWVCKLQPPQHSHLQTGTASYLHPALPSVHATHTPRCPEISKGKQYSTGDQFPPAACLPDTKPHRAACGLRILPTLWAWVSFSVPSSLLGNGTSDSHTSDSVLCLLGTKGRPRGRSRGPSLQELLGGPRPQHSGPSLSKCA